MLGEFEETLTIVPEVRFRRSSVLEHSALLDLLDSVAEPGKLVDNGRLYNGSHDLRETLLHAPKYGPPSIYIEHVPVPLSPKLEKWRPSRKSHLKVFLR